MEIATRGRDSILWLAPSHMQRTYRHVINATPTRSALAPVLELTYFSPPPGPADAILDVMLWHGRQSYPMQSTTNYTSPQATVPIVQLPCTWIVATTCYVFDSPRQSQQHLISRSLILKCGQSPSLAYCFLRFPL